MSVKVFLLSVLFLWSCSSSYIATTNDTGVFSLWAEIDGCRNLHVQYMEEFNAPLNLNVYYDRYLDTKAQCNIDFTFIGDHTKGQYVVSNSVYVGDSGEKDPGCNSLNETGNYEHSSEWKLLLVPSSGDPRTYHWCSWDHETNTSTCIPVNCGIL